MAFDIRVKFRRPKPAIPEQDDGTSKVDKLITSKIAGLQLDENSIQAHKVEQELRIRRLNAAMQQADSSAPDSRLTDFAQAEASEILRYQSELSRQLADLIGIIDELKKMAEHEFKELLYDVRVPLISVEDFINKLKPVISKFRNLASRPGAGSLDSQQIEKLAGIGMTIGKIEKDLEEFLNHVSQFIEGDLRYFSGIGAFSPRDFTAASRKNLDVYLAARASLRAEIESKIRLINSGFQSLESLLRSLEAVSGSMFYRCDDLASIISSFRKEIQVLLQFCFERIKVSNHLIVESVLLQKEYFVKLEKLRQDFDRFCGEFDRSRGKPATRWRTAEIQRIEAGRTKTLEKLKAFRKDFDRKILKIQAKNLRNFRIERKEEEVTLTRIRNLLPAVRKVSAAAALLLTLGGITAGVSKDVRDAAKNKAVEAYFGYERLLNIFYSVKRDFAAEFGEKDIRYKIVDGAISFIDDGAYYGIRAPQQDAAMFARFSEILPKNFKPTDCISFINSVLSAATGGAYRGSDQIDKIIAHFKKQGWKVYFVSTDPTNTSTLLKGECANDYIPKIKRGKYPNIGGVNEFVIGPEAVKEFQKMLRGKVGIVSFNCGFHSGFVIDGKVVQAHWATAGPNCVEGKYTFSSHLSSANKEAAWEFAFVAIAPG